MTLLKLLLVAAMMLPSAIQTQNGKAPVTPPAAPLGITPPSIKMGLWEANVTNSLIAKTLKTRSCITPQSYQDALAHVPPGCTMTNKTQTPTHISADVSCTLEHGGASTGHVEVEMPDQTTVRSKIDLSISVQGRTMPITLTTDSHFVGADCGDLSAGQSKVIP